MFIINYFKLLFHISFVKISDITSRLNLSDKTYFSAQADSDQIAFNKILSAIFMSASLRHILYIS